VNHDPGASRESSFADAELREYRIQQIFDIDISHYLSEQSGAPSQILTPQFQSRGRGHRRLDRGRTFLQKVHMASAPGKYLTRGRRGSLGKFLYRLDELPDAVGCRR
jgi:hypothetical protein